jgi:hypothetical protein
MINTSIKLDPAGGKDVYFGSSLVKSESESQERKKVRISAYRAMG